MRICGLVYESCEQVPSARQTLHELSAVPAILPLLTSSAEEVQEAAARAIEKLSRMPAAAIAVRRSDGIPLLIDLMTSSDEGVQLASISAVMNVAHSDPKAAAAIRDAEGLKPLVAFLTSANVQIQIASCTAILGCSKNEANKSILRELGAIDLLLKMLPFTNARDAQAAAVATLACLTLNEDEARVLLRLQGGMKKLQALLYANDPLLQAHAAQVFAHCAPNKDSRIAIRLADCLAPLVGLLSSPHAAARLSSAGALMQSTQATRTNQVKCRELGSIAPLLRLLEPPEEGPPDREAQRRGVWTLSNIACEPTAAKQLRQSPSGFSPLIILIAGGDPILQRPAAACLFNASANDLGAPTAIEQTGGLPALSDALLYAKTNGEASPLSNLRPPLPPFSNLRPPMPFSTPRQMVRHRSANPHLLLLCCATPVLPASPPPVYSSDPTPNPHAQPPRPQSTRRSLLPPRVCYSTARRGVAWPTPSWLRTRRRYWIASFSASPSTATCRRWGMRSEQS